MIRKPSVNYMLQIGLVLSQFLPAALLPVEAAQLVYENTFESGLGDASREAMPMTPAGCENQKFSVVSDPVGGGSKVLKIMQQGGQECLVSADLKHRALVKADNPDGSGLAINKYGVDYFFGVRFYIADFNAAYYAANGFSHTFWNIKTQTARESKMELRGNNGVATIEAENRYSTNTPKVGTEYKIGSQKFVVPEKEWVNLVIQIRRATDNTGIYKVWMNGKLVVNFTNTRTATDPSEIKDGPYTRWGVYWGDKDRASGTTIYYDDWRIAIGSDGYAMVDPSNGAAPPSIPSNLKLITN